MSIVGKIKDTGIEEGTKNVNLLKIMCKLNDRGIDIIFVKGLKYDSITKNDTIYIKEELSINSKKEMCRLALFK